MSLCITLIYKSCANQGAVADRKLKIDSKFMIGQIYIYQIIKTLSGRLLSMPSASLRSRPTPTAQDFSLLIIRMVTMTGQEKTNQKYTCSLNKLFTNNTRHSSAVDTGRSLRVAFVSSIQTLRKEPSQGRSKDWNSTCTARIPGNMASLISGSDDNDCIDSSKSLSKGKGE